MASSDMMRCLQTTTFVSKTFHNSKIRCLLMETVCSKQKQLIGSSYPGWQTKLQAWMMAWILYINFISLPHLYRKKSVLFYCICVSPFETNIPSPPVRSYPAKCRRELSFNLLCIYLHTSQLNTVQIFSCSAGVWDLFFTSLLMVSWKIYS